MKRLRLLHFAAGTRVTVEKSEQKERIIWWKETKWIQDDPISELCSWPFFLFETSLLYGIEIFRFFLVPYLHSISYYCGVTLLQLGAVDLPENITKLYVCGKVEHSRYAHASNFVFCTIPEWGNLKRHILNFFTNNAHKIVKIGCFRSGNKTECKYWTLLRFQEFCNDVKNKIPV